MSKDVLRIAAVFTVALTATACSTMSDVGDEVGSAVSEVGSALDPTGWFSDTPPEVAASELPDSAVTTPDLAALPPRPAPTAAPDSQSNIASSLAADRAQSGYSAEALRGGTEAAAPPPPAAPRTAVLPPPAAPAPSAPASAAPTVAALPDVAPAATPAAPAAVAAAAPAQSTPVLSPAPSAAGPRQPAVPPLAGGGNTRVAVNTVSPTDAQLGFRPSTAPALDPSISQWVAPPIVARFQQSAAQAGGRVSDARVASVSGAARVSPYAALGAGAPAAVVQFPGDGTLLSAQGRTQIRSIAQAFKAQGGQGSVRVVGHASSRTANMPVERHLAVIFEKSQARANAVAQELIRQGVPAAKVLIEAVGDSQPIYYESMPEGEAGNRRAEIFLQG